MDDESPRDHELELERVRHAEYPTERDRLRELERVVITEMQLHQLSTQERRGFMYAYRSLLRGILSTADHETHTELRTARWWALAGVGGGTIVGIVLETVLRVVVK